MFVLIRPWDTLPVLVPMKTIIRMEIMDAELEQQLENTRAWNSALKAELEAMPLSVVI